MNAKYAVDAARTSLYAASSPALFRVYHFACLITGNLIHRRFCIVLRIKLCRFYACTVCAIRRAGSSEHAVTFTVLYAPLHREKHTNNDSGCIGNPSLRTVYSGISAGDKLTRYEQALYA